MVAVKSSAAVLGRVKHRSPPKEVDYDGRCLERCLSGPSIRPALANCVDRRALEASGFRTLLFHVFIATGTPCHIMTRQAISTELKA